MLQRLVLKTVLCTCTNITSYLSNGVDIRPRVGCDPFGTEEPYCYVRQTCPGSVASEAFPGAHYVPCTASPPPPPVGYCLSDPEFPNQWHHDKINGPDAWNKLRLFDDEADPGEGVAVAVIDNGVQASHPDLTLKVDDSYAWDLTGDRVDHNSVRAGPHGTACAGIFAAIAENGNGGCGVSHGVTLLSGNLLGRTLLLADSTIADAFDAFRATADVLSNSWGPADDLRWAAPLGPRTLEALDRLRTDGRNGKGSVVVFAAGNGGPNDNTNWDPYCAHPYTIAVGAVGDDDQKTFYSEPGTCILVSGPSGGGIEGITTTDLTGIGRGYNRLGSTTDVFGGTSAATPVVAGVVALILQRRPDFTWRDVQRILAYSARKNDPLHPDWIVNRAGWHFNRFYGFGMVDASRAIDLCEGWDPVPPTTSLRVTVLAGSASPTTLWTKEIEVTEDGFASTVQLEYDATHPNKGQVEVSVTSPSGTKSVLTSTFEVELDADEAKMQATKALSYACMDEPIRGRWTVSMKVVSGSTPVTARDVTLEISKSDKPGMIRSPPLPPPSPNTSPSPTASPNTSPPPNDSLKPPSSPSPAPGPLQRVLDFISSLF